MSHLDRITINPLQCGGRPCIRGMRVRVKDVLDLLAAGVSEPEILADYPYLERDEIRAAREYAAVQAHEAAPEGRQNVAQGASLGFDPVRISPAP